jgi:hypothetical protein
VAVKSVDGAPRQDEWVENRRGFRGERADVVAEARGGVVGYAAVERRPDDPNETYRIFLVTDWEDTSGVPGLLYEWVETELAGRRARAAWLREYAADASIAAFVRARGFEVQESYELDGIEMVTLVKDLRGSAPAG